MRCVIVRVPVANVWTKPISGEWVELALSKHGWMKYWVDSLTLNGRFKLWKENLLQTQVLLGDRVIVVKEEGEWVEVRVPSQPSSKDKVGYPGWMHKSQLGELPFFVQKNEHEHFVVTVPQADLLDKDEDEKQVIVYQTSLPVVHADAEWVYVMTPDGLRKVQKDAGVFVLGRLPKKGSGQELFEYGEQFIGLPYLWGGTSAFGYDCSGFTSTLARAIGVVIPRDAHDQAKAGKAVKKEDWQPGDLLFFAHEKGKGFIHHVAVYAGNGMMLHAPKTGRNVEITLIAGVYAEEICAIRRMG
jgi:hypothetical protein